MRLAGYGRLVAIVWLFSGCGPDGPPRFESHVEGILSIRDQADSTRDFADFEVLVASQLDGDVDTLGITTTDREGRFSMTLSTLEKGIYPLIIRRAGAVMAVEEIVVAEGDSARISGNFPLDARGLRIISMENAAWMAYRNAKAQHNRMLLELVQTEGYAPSEMEQVMTQTSTVMWSLQTPYPRTMGADLASVESIMMLEGWNDSLVVARMQEIPLDQANLIDAIRAARRSKARLEGQGAAVSLIQWYLDQMTDDEIKAALQAEIVVAYTDSLQQDLALAAALKIRRNWPESVWAQWASRAAYELENLMPGMEAPSFSVVSRDGKTIRSQDQGLRYRLIEFYDPQDTEFRQELADRNLLFEALDERLFETLSISVESDTTINEALFEESTPPGIFVFPEGGINSDIARLFNVQVVPTRYLIGLEGQIIGKYKGPALQALALDLVRIVNDYNQRAAADN